MTQRRIYPGTSLLSGPGVFLRFCVDLASSTWLYLVFSTFTQSGGSAPWRALLFGLCFAFTVKAADELVPLIGGLPARLRHATLVFASGAAAALVTGVYTLSSHQIVWLAAGSGVLSCVVRSRLKAYADQRDDAGMELTRWLTLTGASVALYWPFYRASAVGAGDAHWYSLMIADVAEQWRNGQFPAWVGESRYAFNGAVNPLRIAPLLQHVGGFISLLSNFTLEPTALKNATLAALGLSCLFSAYASLNVLAGGSRWFAACGAILWTASPGVLGPPMLSDMYLSAAAMVFIPPVFACCWLLLNRDGTTVRIGLSASLAGAWLSHAPIAAWLTLLAAACWAWRLRSPSARKEEGRRLAIAAASFVVLGSLPFLSTLSLHLPSPTAITAEPSLENVHQSFPGILMPITDVSRPGTLQPGYSLFAIAIAVLLLGGRRSLQAGMMFSACSIGIALLVIPSPWINTTVWNSFPKAFINVQGAWPEQRLMAIWGFAILGSAATALPSLAGSKARLRLVNCLLIVSLAWTGFQAFKITQGTPIDPEGSDPKSLTSERNLVVSKYAYSFFTSIPGTASHGFVDPALDLRILDKDMRGVLASNAESAAPPLRSDSAPGYPSRLVATGVYTANNDNFSAFYNLSPSLPLPGGFPTALRLEFIENPINGYLQINAPGLFREYMLPDSGQGITFRQTPRSFGALPTSSRVIPLGVSPKTESIEARLILPGHRVVPSMPAARYWLYRYLPTDLPIRLRSLTPFRAEADSACEAWLETTRVWMDGYQAIVNGAPAEVARSAENLVLVRIPRGTSRIELNYHAPLLLTLSYWAALGGWALLLASALRRGDSPD